VFLNFSYDHANKRLSTLTSIAGTLGAPQLSLPVAFVDGLPVGLSLLGRPGADEMLLAFARELPPDS
jgi:amidase